MHKFTVVQSAGTALNKSFDENGKKTSNALLSYGAFQVENVNNVRELFQRFKTLLSNQAIIPSVPKNGETVGSISSRNIDIELMENMGVYFTQVSR